MKSMALQHLSGSLLFAFFAILFFVPTITFAEPILPLVQCGLTPGPGVESAYTVPCDFDAFVALVGRIIDFLLWIASFIAALMFAYAGFKYITAAGNESQIKDATKIFKTVFFGIAIALGAYLVVELIVDSLLKEDISPLTYFFLSTWGV